LLGRDGDADATRTLPHAKVTACRAGGIQGGIELTAGLHWEKARPSMTSMKSRYASEAFTSVTTEAFDVDGEPAGLAISLGHNLLFFTTDPDLASLDGASFADRTRLEARVRHLRALRDGQVRRIA
jgi:hypothetical protein